MKNIKEILKRNWFGLLIALLILLLATDCHFRNLNELEVQKDNVASLEKEMVTNRLKNGQLISSVRTLQFDKKQLKDLVYSKDVTIDEMRKEFSNVKAITKEITVTEIELIPIVYRDSVPCVFERNDTIQKKWFSFGYRSTQKGMDIHDFNLKDSVTHVGGTKRKWLFGKQTATLDITHANEYVRTTSASHYEIPVEKNFVEKYWLKEIAAFALGFFITK